MLQRTHKSHLSHLLSSRISWEEEEERAQNSISPWNSSPVTKPSLLFFTTPTSASHDDSQEDPPSIRGLTSVIPLLKNFRHPIANLSRNCIQEFSNRDGMMPFEWSCENSNDKCTSHLRRPYKYTLAVVSFFFWHVYLAGGGGGSKGGRQNVSNEVEKRKESGNERKWR